MINQNCACGARYAIGFLRCPRCKQIAPQHAANVKEEHNMPHTTVESGPSNAGAEPGETGFVERVEREAAEAAAEIKAEVHVVSDWASKPVAHLRKAAAERGLDAAGPKAALAARLAEHDTAQVAAEPEPAAEEVLA